MTPIRRTPWAALLALCLPLSPALRAQEPEPDQRAQAALNPADLELRYFQPRNVQAAHLYEYARETLGRRLPIADASGRPRIVDTVGLVGDRIVLFDEPGRVVTLLERLRAVDGAEQPAREEAELVTREYVPRFVSLQSATDVLEPFQFRRRDVLVFTMEGRNAVALRAAPAEVEAMLAELRRIDVPAPQATLTCYLVRQAPERDPRLPAQLSDGLRAVLPGQEFALSGLGVLRTSVAPGRQVDLAVETEGGTIWNLSLVPSAFDPETGSLSVDFCELRRTVPAGSEGESGGYRKVFSTSAVFRGDEYTVLSATGADPVFLVVRLAPQS